MRGYLKISIYSFMFFLFVSCGGTNLNPVLIRFADSTSILEDSINDIFDEMQNLEIEMKGEESIVKRSVSPQDFIPDIFTESVTEVRRQLMRTLTKYSESLLTIFQGEGKDIYKSMDSVKNSIKNISDRHPDFFAVRDKGILFAVLTSVPKVLTLAKRKRFAVKIMQSMQKIIEKISVKLIEEIESSLLVSNNFFSRLFRERVAKRWPEKEAKRGKYSVKARKLIMRRYLIKGKGNSLIRAVKLFPKAHMAIIISIKKKRDYIFGIKEFVAYVYRMKTNWRSLKGEG